MSQLIELFDQLSQAGATWLLIALAVSSSLIAIIRNWRITLPLMVIQYVAVGMLLAQASEPGVALIKPLAGAIVCFALSIAAQRADAQRAERGESVALSRLQRPNLQRTPAQLLLRAIAAMLVLTTAFGAAIRFPLPGSARALDLGAYMLIGFGVLLVATAFEALNAGLGLLMLLSGVELVFTPLEPSVSVSVLFGLMTLLVGVAISYLTLADGGALHTSVESRIENEELRPQHPSSPQLF